MNLKKTLLLALVLTLSFSAFAKEQLLKTFDGTVATCKSQDDVVLYMGTGVISMKLNKVTDLGDSIALRVSVGFYSCKNTVRGFMFERMPDPSRLSYPLTDRRVTIERKDFTLRAISGDYEVLDSQLVGLSTSTNETTLTFAKSQVSTLASGKKFVDLDLTALMKFSDSRGTAGNFEQRTFGSFRLLF